MTTLTFVNNVRVGVTVGTQNIVMLFLITQNIVMSFS